ncbi:MAG: DNA adenine methylase [Bacteroidaceae bacterium]|nr:DNA adenine methylase [Bacteroidaceae bacterium]
MSYNFRTLNYLGSKLRLLDFIEDKVLDVTPQGAGICDLFAGSGCVSRKLSRLHPVVSCDIQGYSKVIGNALLNQFDVTDKMIEDFFMSLDNESANKLLEAFTPLIELEQNAIENKNLDVLTCILEHGSLEVFNLEHNFSCLSDQLVVVSKNLKKAGFDDVRSLISRYYGGVYFSYKQAVDIDIILENIHKFVSEDNHDLFLAALLSTASDIVDTVGKHFAQPIKARDSKGNIKITVYNKAVKDKTIDVFALYREWLLKYRNLSKSDCQHITMQGDYEQCLRSLPDNVRTIYADPPYTRDHYSRYYHVLETLTLRDTPKISTVSIHGSTHVSNGIYREDRHQSPFCIKSKAPEAFRKMFELTASTGRNLLLSYSPYDETKKTHPRVVTMQQLITLAEEYFDNVETVSAGSFKHNKLNSTEHFLEASDEAELLIVCTNN